MTIILMTTDSAVMHTSKLSNETVLIIMYCMYDIQKYILGSSITTDYDTSSVATYNFPLVSTYHPDNHIF